jgi:hypothetical protein
MKTSHPFHVSSKDESHFPVLGKDDVPKPFASGT